LRRLISPLVLIPGVCGFDEECQDIRKSGAGTNDEQCPTGATRPEVFGRLGDHRPTVAGDQHTPGMLGPGAEIGVGRRERSVGRVADPDRIGEVEGLGVVMEGRTSDVAAQMVVEKVANSHGSRLAERSARGRSFGDAIAVPERGRAGLRCRLLPLESGPVFRDVGVYLGPMRFAKGDDAPEQLRLRRWELVVNLVRGVSALVAVHDGIKADPVARQHDLAIGPSTQEVGEIRRHPPLFELHRSQGMIPPRIGLARIALGPTVDGPEATRTGIDQSRRETIDRPWTIVSAL
jgi:hypothetical protein